MPRSIRVIGTNCRISPPSIRLARVWWKPSHCRPARRPRASAWCSKANCACLPTVFTRSHCAATMPRACGSAMSWWSITTASTSSAPRSVRSRLPQGPTDCASPTAMARSPSAPIKGDGSWAFEALWAPAGAALQEIPASALGRADGPDAAAATYPCSRRGQRDPHYARPRLFDL
jgi:hypothetical protein